MENVLIVAAHPDDEVLGCGGTIARHVDKGDRVSVLILGEGITSRFETREEGRTSPELDQLRKATEKVREILEIEEVILHDLPDNRFDSVDLLDIIKVIERAGDRISPDVVYTHFGGDLNIDHRLTFQSVLTAFRPLPGSTVKRILSFEAASSTEWAPPVGANAFIPNTFVDVSAHMEKKIAALAAYQTEQRPYPHPRSPEAVQTVARRWGVQAGLEMAEPFMLIRSIWSKE